MACSSRSGKCTRRSKFSFFFTSQQQFDKDIAAGKGATKDRPITPVPRDPNRVDYNKTGVHEIGEKDFKSFVAEQDVCLVLFYSKDGEDSAIAMEALSKAAGVTDRPYSTFAQVDCSKNFDLCISEGAERMPFYRMYSKGATVGTIRDYLSLPSQSMQAFVETCPVLTQAPRPTQLCMLFQGRK